MKPAPFVPSLGGVPDEALALAGAPAGGLRGANQSLPLFSLAGFSAAGSATTGVSRVSGPGATGAACAPLDAEAPGRGMEPVRSPPGPSTSLMGVRMTTGGMGREPGMLIRIRVVSVVSVLGSSG